MVQKNNYLYSKQFLTFSHLAYVTKENFLSPTFNSSEVYIRASDVNRCIQSARVSNYFFIDLLGSKIFKYFQEYFRWPISSFLIR